MYIEIVTYIQITTRVHFQYWTVLCSFHRRSTLLILLKLLQWNQSMTSLHHSPAHILNHTHLRTHLSPKSLATMWNLWKSLQTFAVPFVSLFFMTPLKSTAVADDFANHVLKLLLQGQSRVQPASANLESMTFLKTKDRSRRFWRWKFTVWTGKQVVEWKGELCQLDNHLNLDPEKGRKIDTGCPYAVVKCIHCSEDCPRHHMLGCPQQQYTCPYCESLLVDLWRGQQSSLFCVVRSFLSSVNSAQWRFHERPYNFTT